MKEKKRRWFLKRLLKNREPDHEEFGQTEEEKEIFPANLSAKLLADPEWQEELEPDEETSEEEELLTRNDRFLLDGISGKDFLPTCCLDFSPKTPEEILIEKEEIRLNNNPVRKMTLDDFFSSAAQPVPHIVTDKTHRPTCLRCSLPSSQLIIGHPNRRRQFDPQGRRRI